MRLLLAATLAMSVVACTSSPGATVPVTPQVVSAQASDLPAGFVVCDGAGDIDSHLTYLKSTNPAGYQTASLGWNEQLAAGATGAWVQELADSAAQCARFTTGQPSGSSAPRVVLDFAIVFKDTPTAQAEFGKEVFGFNPADFEAQGGTGVKGEATGLGPNSNVVTLTVNGNTTFFLAIWQKASYMVALLATNLALTDDRHLVSNMNTRIR